MANIFVLCFYVRDTPENICAIPTTWVNLYVLVAYGLLEQSMGQKPINEGSHGLESQGRKDRTVYRVSTWCRKLFADQRKWQERGFFLFLFFLAKALRI